MKETSSPYYARVGFDYVTALKELLERFTYEELAQTIGYKSGGALTAIVKGKTIPSHIHGEALWALYHDTFNRKPPMSTMQRNACDIPETQA